MEHLQLDTRHQRSAAFQPVQAPNATATATATNATAPPLPLKLFIKGENDNYCGAEPALPDTAPVAYDPSSAGGWLKYTIPISAFSCFDLGAMTLLEFQNVNAVGADWVGSTAEFCLGEVQLVK